MQHADELREDHAVEEVSAQQPQGEHAIIPEGQARSRQAHQQHANADHPLQLSLRGLQGEERRGTIKMELLRFNAEPNAHTLAHTHTCFLKVVLYMFCVNMDAEDSSTESMEDMTAAATEPMPNTDNQVGVR